MKSENTVKITSTEELRDFIIQILEDKKAEDIVVVDTKIKTPIAEYMIFASGKSTRNVSAIADNVSLALKQSANINNSIEGLGTSEWVLIDVGSIVVHVFHHEARKKYDLEDFWRNH